MGDGIVEHVFEIVTDAELIDFMGEETREESAAIARRLAAVAELFVRRSGALADLEWCCADGCDSVAARGVGGPEHQPCPRAGSGASSAAPTTLDEEVMPQLDETIARHVAKWMKLSGPKLRDRVDLWVAQFDPAGVRVSPKVKDNRYVDLYPASPGMAGLSGYLHAADGAALDQRLDALAATVCDNDPRTKEQRRADACGPLARGQAVLACQCGTAQCTAAADRNAAVAAVIHVRAEQTTIDGTSAHPGYLPGFGILPAESVREPAATAQIKPLQTPAGATPDPGYRPSAKTSSASASLCQSCAAAGPCHTCGDIPLRICIGLAQAAAIALSSPLLKASTYWRLIRRSQRLAPTTGGVSK